MANSDAELLHRYAEARDEGAFGELVRRHLNLVYSVALRQVGGDAHRAQDVAQRVFTDLARKAASLTDRTTLGGWLYHSAHFAASDLVRADRARRAREQEAWHMHEPMFNPSALADWEKFRPLLDEAIGELGERDRDAVVLRYFESRPFAEIGAALQVSEDAARIRVDRALEKLHAALSRRGITSTTAALGIALTSQVGIAAPAGLAASVTGAALAGVTASGGKTGAVVAVGLLHFLATAKLVLPMAAVVAAVATAVATNQAADAGASRVALAAVAREQDALQVRLAALQDRLAAAERRAQAAETDATQLLKAIQDASPTVGLPAGKATCVAFVIDTSGSMRDPKTGMLWPVVGQAIADTLAAHPEVDFVQLFDADGRVIVGGNRGWLPRNAETERAIAETLGRYDQDTISNPVPGIYRAMRALPPAGKGGARLDVCVIGDEFVDQPEPVLRRLAELNPADAKGNRRATISAIQVPTTIRFIGGTMGNTGLKFQALMRDVTRQHGGAYKLLPFDSLH